MKISKIKPIPKNVLKLIRKKDKELYPKPTSLKRFYSYLTKNDSELVKVTVAVRHKFNAWYCKQVAVHGIDSDYCYVRDMVYYYIAGYVVGWHDEGLTNTAKWYEAGWGCAEDKMFDPFAPMVNAEYALKLPEFKYSAINVYPYCDTLQYLRLYRKYPQMEYLTKLGLNYIAMSVQILRLCAKDKKFRKWLARNVEQINENYYYVSAIIEAYKKNKPIKEVHKRQEYEKKLSAERDYPELRREFKQDAQKLFEYINSSTATLSSYNDYLKACLYLGVNMKDTKNRYPKDFKRWHDIRVDEYHSAKAKEEETLRTEFYQQFSSIAQKYSVLEQRHKGAYVVLIARTPAELVKEGYKLDHCVGKMGYDKKMARGESLIFFVRNKEEETTPFVTIEFSPKEKKILQCYGKNDSRPNDDVLNFVNNEWLPYTKQQLKQIAA